MSFSPLLLSLQVSLFATLLIAVFGTPLALLLSRKKLPARAVLETLTLLPLVLPPTVTGYYLLTTFGIESVAGKIYRSLTGNDLVFTLQGAILAACIVGFPLYVRTAQTALSSVDRELSEQAQVDGASWGQTIFLVRIPLAKGGMIGGISMAFARTLGDFGATLMIAGNIPGKTRTASMAIYDAVENNDVQTAGLLSLCLAGMCLLCTLLAVHALRHD